MHIENFLVIEALDVRFAPGFTALTGETGAGKSLLIQALGLVAGGRASQDVVRAGCERALIEARLKLQAPAARARLAEEGYGDDGEVLVRRIIAADGAHRVYLNGRMATAQTLQELIGPELEIHAQHSQQRLLEPEVQTALIDRAGGLSDAVAATAAAYRAWRELVAEAEALEAQAGQRERELDYLKFQLDEFERIAPQPGEDERLEAEVRRWRGRAAIEQALAAAAEWLSDGEGSALDRLFSAEDALSSAAKHDERLVPLAARLANLAHDLREVVHQLRDVRTGGNDDLTDLDGIEARLADLKRLTRKHGGDLAAALNERDRMAAEVQRLTQLEQTLADLRARATAAEAEFVRCAQQLSAARRAAAEPLAARVTADLRALEMPHAIFAVGGWGEGRPGPSGLDRVTFLLAANPGEPPRALKRVASGGELSRVLLAIQAVIGTEVPGATVVFDEVDTGIGGETAVTVGARMRALGEHAQVLAVTHTPQVAAAAHAHLRLEKVVEGERTRTRARSLEADERERELARMLGGSDAASAQEHARTLLATAGVRV